MNVLIRPLTCVSLLLLLAGCGPDYEPPDVKTNPNPQQRYAITVTLVDPPPGIRSITGMTHFVPSTPCRPLVDSINGIPVSANYKKAFFLTKITENTYQGHIYLDWPVDEDYYGLGVCKWKLRTAKAHLHSAGYAQHVTVWGDDMIDTPTHWSWWCPRKENPKTVRDCFRPEDPSLIEKARIDHYNVTLETKRI